MAKQEGKGEFRLQVPIDASGLSDFQDKTVKVVALDAKHGIHEEEVRFNKDGKATATFSFHGHPGSLRLLFGPQEASAEQLKGLQTLSVDVSSANWGDTNELKLQEILIPPYYWRWWWWWCRDFKITGRVLCADGSPVPGAKVCAYDVTWWWWWVSENQIGCTTTDVTGAFEIDFRWCCGWWPWWWWETRFWRLEPLLAQRIQTVLGDLPKVRNIPTPDPAPSLALFQDLLDAQRSQTGLASNRLLAARGLSSAKFDVGRIDGLRSELMKVLPASAELTQLRVWPWWWWRPWWDCEPDVIFKVTQNCRGVEQTIVDETIFDTRWDIPTNLNVTLTANQNACCITHCRDPKECPDGDCLVITDVCDDLIANIGGNPGAPAAPEGYLNPGLVSVYGDQPYAAVVPIQGIFGANATADYYEFEWSNNGGVTWKPMPPAAAGGFTRWFWGPGFPGPVGWHSVNFPFQLISGHFVIESRQHFEANNGAGTWGITRFWDASTENLLMNWLTDGNFADGLYQLRVRSWKAGGGGLVADTILPLCDTKNDNGVKIYLDNRFVSPVGPNDAYGNPCGPGTVHLCTTEPGSAIVAIRINGNPVTACTTVDAKGGGNLEIDFIAYDAEGHLGFYSLQALYGVNQAIDLLSLPGASLSGGPPTGGVPSAGTQVGPDYAAALGVMQGAMSPSWKGGVITLKINNLKQAFPETCCYQIQLYVHKRTVVNCDDSEWGHVNLSETSFTVIV